METWQKKHINKNKQYLSSNTEFTVLVADALTDAGILHTENVQQLRALDTNIARASSLYEMIQSRIGAYRVLAIALYAYGQRGPLLVLLKGLFLQLAVHNNMQLDQALLESINEEMLMAEENWNVILNYLEQDPPHDMAWFEVLTKCQKRNQSQQSPSHSVDNRKRSSSERNNKGPVSFSEEPSSSKRPCVHIGKESSTEPKRSQLSTNDARETGGKCNTGDSDPKDVEYNEDDNVFCKCCNYEDEDDGNDAVDTYKVLKVQVRQPVGVLEQDNYNVTSDRTKNFALIINITEFDNDSLDREGAQHDTMYMKELWTGLGFTVIQPITGYVTKHRIMTAIQKFKQNFANPLLTQTSCVVFIGSHGSRDHFLTSQHERLNVYKDVVYKFGRVGCPNLNERPKVFILQFCQQFPGASTNIPGTSTNHDEDEYDDNHRPPPPIQHAMVVNPTLPGYPAARNRRVGSWLVYCLTEVFMNNAWNTSLSDLLQMTTEKLKNLNRSEKVKEGQVCVPTPFAMQKLFFRVTPVSANLADS